MARLRDAGAVIRKIGVREFVRRVWTQVDEDNVFAWASSLSYSWILALFPFLIFLLTLIPYIPMRSAKDEAREQLQKLVHTLPRDTAAMLEDFLEKKVVDILDTPHNGVLVTGLLITLWAASGGVAATTTALDKAWDVDQKRSFVRRRISAVKLTVIVSSLLMLILVLLPIGTQVLNLIREHTPRELRRTIHLLNILRWTMGVVVMFVLIEVVYFFGPNIKQRWRWVSPGSLFCALAWILLGLAFRFYVDKFGKYGQTYGAVGGVVVLLLVFYFDALVLLVGAEINSEIDFELLGVTRGTRDFTRAEAT